MTKYEKIDLLVNLLSLLCSIIFPIIFFYKLNNELPPIGERPQIEIKDFTERGISVKIFGNPNETYQARYEYDMTIFNIGKRPTKQVDISIKYHNDDYKKGGRVSIDTDPYVGDDTKYSFNAAHMRVTQPIGSQKELKIHLVRNEPIASICFITEYGDRTCQEYENEEKKRLS